LIITDPKKSGGGSGPQGSVADLVLCCQIRHGFDRSLHPLDGQEGCQVGRVRRDDDQGEEPPEARDRAAGHRPEELKIDFKNVSFNWFES
jgi:hypothetical protein